MKTHKSLLWFLVLIAYIMSCQKEKSYEVGNTNPSTGSLQSSLTGDCLGSAVAGSYKVDSALTDSNYVDVNVDVITAGSYTIGSDTLNGFFFKGSGSFNDTGVVTVRLTGNGTPADVGTHIFTITYDSSQCTFSVTTLPGTSGGTAVFTLEGAPNSCVPGSTQGIYTAGVATNNTNTATVNVDVTTAGTYSIVTSLVNGVTFTASGIFSSTGPQQIVLNASGTPAADGSFSIPVTIGSTTCSFPLAVGGIVDYFPRTTNSNWSYQFNGNSDDTLYTNVISQTQSALGNSYNIFMLDDGSGSDTLGYFRKSGNDYYQYLDISSLFVDLETPAWGEYIFLKDNSPAGTTWTSDPFVSTITDSASGISVPVSVRIKETIDQKDVPVTILGVTYQNTIVVKEEYEISSDGVTWNLYPAVTTNYFARNVGLIKTQLEDNSGFGNSYLQELRRYEVF